MSKIDTCPECGAIVVTRHGPYGSFIGCSAYPKCKWTETVRRWEKVGRDPEKYNQLHEIILENWADAEGA